MATTISCPACARSIPFDAIVCPYCARAVAAPPPSPVTAAPVRWRTALLVIAALVVVGLWTLFSSAGP
jgi:hypothetical protein